MKNLIVFTLILFLIGGISVKGDFFSDLFGIEEIIEKPISEIIFSSKELSSVCTINTMDIDLGDGKHSLTIGELYLDSNCTTLESGKSIMNSQFRPLRINIEKDNELLDPDVEILDYYWENGSIAINFKAISKDKKDLPVFKELKNKSKLEKGIKIVEETTGEVFLKEYLKDEEVLHIGKNSTTLTIVEGTSSAEYGMVRTESADPTENYGGSTTLSFINANNIYGKFNISSIPSGSTILKANLTLGFISELLDSLEKYKFSLYHVYDTYEISAGVEWREGNNINGIGDTDEIDWNNQPSTSYYNTTIHDYVIFENGQTTGETFNIITGLQREVNADNEDYSIFIDVSTYSGSPSSLDTVTFASDDYTTDTSLRPKVVIIYDLPSNCTCTNGQQWNVDASDSCRLNTACNTLPYGMTCTGTGYVIINASLTTNMTFMQNRANTCKIFIETTKGGVIFAKP